MQTVLQSKAKYSPEFREALINSENVIAEAVPGELFWSTGLNKEITLCVKKASWPGKNSMEKLLSTQRGDPRLTKEESWYKINYSQLSKTKPGSCLQL